MSKQNEVEIDLLNLIKVLWVGKFIILVAAVFCGVLGWLISSFLITPTYTSATKIYVVNQQSAETVLTAQDLQAGSYLVKDYQQIITSESVLSAVIAEENLSLTMVELADKISVEVPSDTRIVTIRVEDTSAGQAASLANAVRKRAAAKIREVTKVSDVTTLEEAKEAQEPSSPNTKRNTLLAMLAGAFLAAALIVLLELLNDQVRKPEDVEEAMGLPLLAVIPDTDKLN